jgi:chromosome segregation ATPase
MAPLVSNDLNSPVSLLWAHQLRREHATIVAQLEELKALHPSASELKKLVTRTEKTEAATNKLRKDFTDLRAAHQKNLKNISGIAEDVRAHQKAHAGDVAVREKIEQSFQHELEAFREALTLQEGEVASAADELENVRRLAEDGKAAMEQKLLRKEDEIVELRSRIQALEQRIEDEITVVRDSVECPRTTGSFFFPIIVINARSR